MFWTGTQFQRLPWALFSLDRPTPLLTQDKFIFIFYFNFVLWLIYIYTILFQILQKEEV